MATPQTIQLNLVDETVQNKEGLGNGVITPGDLVENPSATGLVRHSVAAGDTQRLFALPNTAVGGTIDTDYASGDTVRYGVARTGDEIYAWLADAVTVVAGVTRLVSNGDGSLKIAVADETDSQIVGTAIEALTASGKTRCRIEAA